jgi:ABC-type Mn2+/Zn2+ transport system ATPase subunit
MSDWLLKAKEHGEGAPPLEVRDVWVYFDGHAALEGISFEVQEGERVAVVGPNGAGKTTLFNVIAGILQPQRGHVRIYGHSPPEHVCIAYVPQRSQVDWRFPATVAEVVMMGRVRRIGWLRWPRKADWAAVERALDRVGLVQERDRTIGELSGGQQQRVFLAQAMAQEAQLVLMDEPFNGLDAPSRADLFAILEALKEEAVPVLVATHDLTMAAERFDRLLLLNRRQIAYGPAERTLDHQSLLQAYGAHIHRLPVEGHLVLTDTCCDGEGMGEHG